MGRPKKAVPAEIEPEEISQEVPEEEPETEEEEEASGGKAISKAAAVRDALEQGEEGPEDGVAYIKKIHGIEMTRQTFSSYKAQQKARDAKKAGGKPAPAAEAPAPRKRPALVQAAPAPKAASNGEPDLIESLETLKPLIAAMGAEKVHRLIDLLG